ncbi:MAG: helix-turn-helix transcriptional regulator, partial [Chloroflexi bacterium]|nr:helix-turn-helix transcriptional regulator [Chloroflexota bacterium]
MKRASLSVEWLESAMIEHNWTQEYVAEHMNVEVKTVQRWKRGENQPHPRQYYRLCQLFGRPLPPGFPREDESPDQGAETQRPFREERQTSLSASLQETEDACTRFLASDLTLRLDRVIRAWFFRSANARYHELPLLLVEELERKDNTMQESPINRRNALRRIAALPIELYSLSFAVPTLLYAPEEFLPRCAAGITACWYLRKGKDLTFV